jgi:hypothetical protein
LTHRFFPSTVTAAAHFPHNFLPLLHPYPPQNVLPDILVVVQVALEGAISKKAAASSLARGEMPQV